MSRSENFDLTAATSSRIGPHPPSVMAVLMVRVADASECLVAEGVERQIAVDGKQNERPSSD